jgi:hypothetical protein
MPMWWSQPSNSEGDDAGADAVVDRADSAAARAVLATGWVGGGGTRSSVLDDA